MNLHEKVAVITGANRGLGLALSRQLAAQGILVVLTSRDKHKGLVICKELTKEELMVRYHPLDVDHAASIAQLKDFVVKEFGRCDILVNNAGIFPDAAYAKADDPRANVLHVELDTIKQTMQTNVYGPLLMCQAFLPLMRQNGYGRIINVSSGLGQLSEMGKGFPSYRLSKTAINALTRMIAAEVDGENILVNSVCPGWCRTDMGGPEATRSVEQGVETMAWLATLPDGGPTGKFFRDKEEIAW